MAVLLNCKAPSPLSGVNVDAEIGDSWETRLNDSRERLVSRYLEYANDPARWSSGALNANQKLITRGISFSSDPSKDAVAKTKHLGRMAEARQKAVEKFVRATEEANFNAAKALGKARLLEQLSMVLSVTGVRKTGINAKNIGAWLADMGNGDIESANARMPVGAFYTGTISAAYTKVIMKKLFRMEVQRWANKFGILAFKLGLFPGLIALSAKEGSEVFGKVDGTVATAPVVGATAPLPVSATPAGASPTPTDNALTIDPADGTLTLQFATAESSTE